MCVTMVTMLPWVFPLFSGQPQDRHQSVLANITAVQDRRLAARYGCRGGLKGQQSSTERLASDSAVYVTRQTSPARCD